MFSWKRGIKGSSGCIDPAMEKAKPQVLRRKALLKRTILACGLAKVKVKHDVNIRCWKLVDCVWYIGRWLIIISFTVDPAKVKFSDPF